MLLLLHEVKQRGLTRKKGKIIIMPYIDKAIKQAIAKGLKNAFPGLKISLSIHRHTTLIVKIKDYDLFMVELLRKEAIFKASALHEEGLVFDADDLKKHGITLYRHSVATEAIFKVIKKAGNWFDRSDILTDYFETAFYIQLILFPGTSKIS